MSAGPEVTTGCSNDETTEKTALSGLSVAEKKFVREGILNDCRTDGRRCDEHRTLQIATGVIPSAFGSARVRNTECDVVCVIKADLCGPNLLSPNEGKIGVDVQFASSTEADNQLRLSSDDSSGANQRLGFALLNGPLNPQFLPRDKLIVVRNRFVWKITVDVMVLTLGGSLLDVSAAALIAAVRSTRLPKIKIVLENEFDAAGEEEEEDDAIEIESNDEIPKQSGMQEGTADDGYFDMRIIRLSKLLSFDVDSAFEGIPLPCSDSLPLLVSIGQVENKLVCDLTGEERLSVDTIIIALINKQGDLLGMRKEGGMPVTLELLSTLGPTLRQTGNLLYSSLVEVCIRAEKERALRSNTYSWCTDVRPV